VYNNTVYLGLKQELPLLLFNTWNGGSATNTQFYNNIFYVDGRATYDWDRSTNNVFENNVFYGAHGCIPSDTHVFTNRPPLVGPGKGGAGFASLTNYMLLPGANFPRGRIVADNGGRDFFGHSVPAGKPWSLARANRCKAQIEAFNSSAS